MARKCASSACGAYAVQGDVYCVAHTTLPKFVALRNAARSKGGKRSHDPNVPILKLESIADCIEALAEITMRVANGQLSCDRAKILQSNIRLLLKLYQSEPETPPPMIPGTPDILDEITRQTETKPAESQPVTVPQPQQPEPMRLPGEVGKVVLECPK